MKNYAPGYTVIDGDKAVVGMTGTSCQNGQTDCMTNNDPAAIFTTLHTFSALWKNATAESNTTYTLNPLRKVAGNWYIYAPS